MSGPRYSVIPAGAICDPRLDGRYDLKVLGLLGTHSDNSGWCYRSQATMAEQLGCGRATVQRALDRLEEFGWIERLAQLRDDGATSVNAYRVVLDVEDADPPASPVRRARPPYERAGARPFHGRAGIRTSPKKTNGRESAGAGGQDRQGAGREDEGDAEARREAAEADERDVEARLAAFRPIWPTTPTDDAMSVEAAMRALDAESRAAAVAGAPVFLAALKADRRKITISGETFLRRRRWEPAVEAAKAQAAGGGAARPGATAAVFDPLTKIWWAGQLMRAKAGVTGFELRKTITLAQSRVGWRPANPEAREAAETLADTLRPTPSDSERAGRWFAWFRERGADFGVLLSGKAMFVFLPDHDPPDEGEDELVA
ncbi:helix-turn-helix domain-containing protein [Chenggangzhangella methanolivorans]|uniref:helix-turn-helix domain-containing protein n=1 Tax=Chenggangzhangella methanolivorans TaxID=1437009 RepID=UPI003610DA8B